MSTGRLIGVRVDLPVPLAQLALVIEQIAAGSDDVRRSDSGRERLGLLDLVCEQIGVDSAMVDVPHGIPLCGPEAIQLDDPATQFGVGLLLERFFILVEEVVERV